MKNILFTIFLLAIICQSYAQEKIKFGEIDPSYFEMTHCPIDSSAGAFIIMDHGYTSLDYNYEIEFTYHVRIKILNSSEFERGNVNIRYFTGDRVTNFKASTFNYENGEIIESKVSRKDALKEEINEYRQSFKFSLPNVKEGSIIEYQYSLNSGNIRSLNTWYFQTSIPVLKSQYQIILPAFLTYKRLLTGRPLHVADITYENRSFGRGSVNHQIHNYEAHNVPAFKDEPYMKAKKDHIMKIDFELQSSNIPGQVYQSYLPNDYAGLAKKFYESDGWSTDIESSRYTKEIVEILKSQSNNNEVELIKNIFNYVQSNMEEDYEIDNISLKKAFAYQKGTAMEINKVLASMLFEAGYSPQMVLLSTRSNGEINPFVPLGKKFNHAIVKLDHDDKTYLMDASDKNTPFGILPKYCVNGRGLVVGNTLEWVDLKSFKKNGITYNGNFELSEEGILSGDLTIRRMGYDAWKFQEELKEDGKNSYLESFDENKDSWYIEDHEISDLEANYYIDEKIVAEIEDKTDDIGDIVYLNPIITGQLSDNPFKTENREFPVNFGSPFTITHLYKIKLNDSFEVTELPSPKGIALPNNGGKLQYSASMLGDEITLTYRLQISKDEFAPELYPYLREFYAQIVEKHGQQIVLSRK